MKIFFDLNRVYKSISVKMKVVFQAFSWNNSYRACHSSGEQAHTLRKEKVLSLQLLYSSSAQRICYVNVQVSIDTDFVSAPLLFFTLNYP